MCTYFFNDRTFTRIHAAAASARSRSAPVQPPQNLSKKNLSSLNNGCQVESGILNFCVESVVATVRAILRTWKVHAISTTATHAILDHFMAGNPKSGSFPSQEMLMVRSLLNISSTWIEAVLDGR